MSKTKTKKAQWELSSETLDLGDGRWGYTDRTRTSGLQWDWVAEGGKLGPLEGRAKDAAQARERVEQALGLRAAGPVVSRVARRRDRVERAKGGA